MERLLCEGAVVDQTKTIETCRELLSRDDVMVRTMASGGSPSLPAAAVVVDEWHRAVMRSVLTASTCYGDPVNRSSRPDFELLVNDDGPCARISVRHLDVSVINTGASMVVAFLTEDCGRRLDTEMEGLRCRLRDSWIRGLDAPLRRALADHVQAIAVVDDRAAIARHLKALGLLPRWVFRETHALLTLRADLQLVQRRDPLYELKFAGLVARLRELGGADLAALEVAKGEDRTD